MKTPKKGMVRVTDDDGLDADVEYYDGGEWRWIGVLTRIDPDTGSGCIFTSSDETLRRVYETRESAIEELMIAGVRGRL